VGANCLQGAFVRLSGFAEPLIDAEALQTAGSFGKGEGLGIMVGEMAASRRHLSACACLPGVAADAAGSVLARACFVRGLAALDHGYSWAAADAAGAWPNRSPVPGRGFGVIIGRCAGARGDEALAFWSAVGSEAPHRFRRGDDGCGRGRLTKAVSPPRWGFATALQDAAAMFGAGGGAGSAPHPGPLPGRGFGVIIGRCAGARGDEARSVLECGGKRSATPLSTGR
jgi:hypothetical protein